MRSRRPFGRSLLVVLALGCCGAGGDAAAQTAAVSWPIPAGSGLSAEERDRFYHLDEGGEIIPLDWLRALESKRTGRPWMEGLERLGFLPDPTRADGLTVGMTTRRSGALPGRPTMVGVTCAACHVGQIEYRGRALRIEGGTNLLSFDDFLEDIADSVAATLEDPRKVWAFLHRLMKERESRSLLGDRRGGAAALFAEIESLDALEQLGGIEKRLADRLGGLFREEQPRPAIDLVPLSTHAAAEKGLLARLLDRGREDVDKLLAGGAAAGRFFGKLDPAASRRALEEAVHEFHDTLVLLKARADLFVKLSGQIAGPRKVALTKGGPGRGDDWAIIRNQILPAEAAIPVVQPLKFPPLWGFGRLAWLHYDGNTTSVMQRNVGQSIGTGAMFDPTTYVSTVEAQNLHDLELLARKLVAPRWPEDVLGAVDAAQAARGKEVFARHCAECHRPEAEPTLYAVEEIGTDPNRAKVFSLPVGGRPFVEVLSEAANKYLDAAYERGEIGPAQQQAIEPEKPRWRATGRYGTRDLAACWASPPYLHNGSVPTLRDLLEPAAKRPKKFWLGRREYDPERLGYAAFSPPADLRSAGYPVFEFDTSLPGNANTGHEYGASLTEREKADLLEYLKTH
ncbi:MAG: hypothetical protein ACOYK7_14850 [Pirellulales bacterium]